MSKRQKSKQTETNESKAIKLLFKAVHKGRVDEVADLIRNGVSVNVTMDGIGCGVWTPLHVAMSNPYNPMIAMMECLVIAGADVNAQNEDGDTPLHQACRHWSIAGALLLLYFGADVNARNNKGETSLHEASNTAVVKLLIEKGAVINAMSNNGCSPLHYFAESGDVEAVRYLVSVGADVNIKDNDGHTALDLAKTENCSGNNAAVIEYLSSVTPLLPLAER